MILSAEPRHHDEILLLCQSLYAFTPDLQLAQFNWSPEKLLTELQSCETSVYLEAGQVAAFLCFRENPDAYEISVLATHPQFQRRGLQSGLLEHLKKQAELKSKAIWLEVHQQNLSAIQFYKSTGFREVGLRPGYYSDSAAAVLMSYP